MVAYNNSFDALQVFGELLQNICVQRCSQLDIISFVVLFWDLAVTKIAAVE